AASRNGEASSLDHVFSPFSLADQERATLLRPGERMRDLPEELWHESYKKRANRRVRDGTPTERRGGAPSGLRRLKADEPSKAITGGALREFVHPFEDRPLTIRECARLQTFPDGFAFHGTQGEKIQMIGNAVPPRLARVIADTLLGDLEKSKSLENRGALLSFVPTASTGMSPILQKVTTEIERKFNCGRISMQEELCL
ncbi:MAG: DNA cytosine methyltransferase, partial [Sphingomonadales bacterium]|nr:DNA cytosine methyltransferase [Sphingomonadales bacterium]